jgi:hypothetical protein
VKRSLFSLVAGCLAALVINSFTARPLWGAIVHRPEDGRAASQASGPGPETVSRAPTERRRAALRPVRCEAPALPALAS